MIGRDVRREIAQRFAVVVVYEWYACLCHCTRLGQAHWECPPRQVEHMWGYGHRGPRKQKPRLLYTRQYLSSSGVPDWLAGRLC